MEFATVIFSYVKQMAWDATFVIPAVLIARLALGRVSRRLSYALWAIVALRLCCPVLPASGISMFWLVPGGQAAHRTEQSAIWPDGADGTPGRQSAADGADGADETPGRQSAADVSALPANMPRPYRASYPAASAFKYIAEAEARGWFCRIWLAGIALMAGYAVSAYARLGQKLRYAIRVSEDVRECGNVHAPFLFGICHPVIYLPGHLTARERDYILAHERCHLRRRDHLIKWFACALLAVYWFHPLAWVAFRCMNRDMELSYDEYVLKNCSPAERREYSRLLLRFSCEKQAAPAAGPCFGEHEIKSRIRHALTHKKRTAGEIAVASAFLILLAAVCLTNAERPSGDAPDGAGTETERAGRLFAAANPYIGDAPADGRLIGAIWEVTGEPEGFLNTQLQTSVEPYGITLHFAEEPDFEVMWNTAALFLALTENCGEFCWDYGTNDTLTTWHIPLSDVNQNLGVNVKEYAGSAEQVEELLELLGMHTAKSPDDPAGPAEQAEELLEPLGMRTVKSPDDPAGPAAEAVLSGVAPSAPDANCLLFAEQRD